MSTPEASKKTPTKERLVACNRFTQERCADPLFPHLVCPHAGGHHQGDGCGPGTCASYGFACTCVPAGEGTVVVDKFIVSGGPGVGKTRTLRELKKHTGIPFIREAARTIIANEQAKETRSPGYSPVLPATNLLRFQELVAARQIRAEARVKTPTVFLDRSLVDVAGYALHGGLGEIRGLTDMIRNAGYSKAFFLERLPTYASDAERHEDLATAIEIHEALRLAYASSGIDVVTVPAAPIKDRVAMILSGAGIAPAST